MQLDPSMFNYILASSTICCSLFQRQPPKETECTGNFTTGHISAYHTKHPVLLGHEETCKETSIVAFNHLTESRAAVCGARTEERKKATRLLLTVSKRPTLT
jgi:hypothetical protein